MLCIYELNYRIPWPPLYSCANPWYTLLSLFDKTCQFSHISAYRSRQAAVFSEEFLNVYIPVFLSFGRCVSQFIIKVTHVIQTKKRNSNNTGACPNNKKKACLLQSPYVFSEREPVNNMLACNNSACFQIFLFRCRVMPFPKQNCMFYTFLQMALSLLEQTSVSFSFFS